MTPFQEMLSNGQFDELIYAGEMHLVGCPSSGLRAVHDAKGDHTCKLCGGPVKWIPCETYARCTCDWSRA